MMVAAGQSLQHIGDGHHAKGCGDGHHGTKATRTTQTTVQISGLLTA